MYRWFAVLVAVLVSAAPAAAHQGNPNMLTRVDDTPSGVTVDVINRDDSLDLHNQSGQDVVIEGYDDEPYARLDADGTVFVNQNSPAYYLNDDRFGEVEVPDRADPEADPAWKELDRTGRFQWHDHRMHWMAKTVPPQVEDESKRQEIFTWSIPVQVDGQPAAIAGTLFWTPDPGTPIGFIVVGSVIVVLLCAGAIVVRRRRDRADGETASEAW